MSKKPLNKKANVGDLQLCPSLRQDQPCYRDKSDIETEKQKCQYPYESEPQNTQDTRRLVRWLSRTSRLFEATSYVTIHAKIDFKNAVEILEISIHVRQIMCLKLFYPKYLQSMRNPPKIHNPRQRKKRHMYGYIYTTAHIYTTAQRRRRRSLY